MTTPAPYVWHTDPLMLAAGNVRGLPGGDPLTIAAPVRPTRRPAPDLGLTAEQLADLRRATRSRLLHPNRRWSPKTPRPTAPKGGQR